MAFPPPFYNWRPHPWHGVEAGALAPEIVTAYIEITPFDLVKYEVDKSTGYLRVDRPQRTSSHPPALYGFIPRTYCGTRVAELVGQPGINGDGDPLDICVISERPINRADVLLSARVVGGIQMLDGQEADDKIVAVLANDDMYGTARDLTDLPSVLVERLRHYFATYKLLHGQDNHVEVRAAYGVEHAHRVIRASLEDYAEVYAGGA